MPRESNDRSQQREDEGEQLSRAAQSDRESDRDPERDSEDKLFHDEDREEIEAELEDLQEMEGPDA
jgi:hypothetical protein